MNKLGVLLLIITLSSCSNLASRLTNEPIQPDPQGRTFGEVIDDNSLRTRLEVNLEKLDPRFEFANVSVHSNAGIVLLVGQVPTIDLINQATQLLKDDPQVIAIHNHLTAEPNVSVGINANDRWLALKTRSRMFTASSFSSSNVEIVVEQGVVYLMGRVTEETANQAVELSTEVNGVQKVVMVMQIIDG